VLVLFFLKEDWEDVGGNGGTEFFIGIILSIKTLEEEDSIDFVFLFDGFRFSEFFSGGLFFAFLAGGCLAVDGG
ncbi:MAG: hypothetical protein ACK55Q_18660, partial [Dolichospermum sp.]